VQVLRGVFHSAACIPSTHGSRRAAIFDDEASLKMKPNKNHIF